MQFVKLQLTLMDDNGLDTIKVFVNEAVSLEHFYGIIPGCEVPFLRCYENFFISLCFSFLFHIYFVELGNFARSRSTCFWQRKLLHLLRRRISLRVCRIPSTKHPSSFYTKVSSSFSLSLALF